MPNLLDLLAAHLPPPRYDFGVGDLRGLLPAPYDAFPLGIAILRQLDDDILAGIAAGPTPAYLDHYHAINRELADRSERLAQALREIGHDSLALPPTVDDPNLQAHYLANLAVPVSHKLVATRAGRGWIGKTDLLVSTKFGPRIRLASVLTYAPLPTDSPIDDSRCGRCDDCVAACPAQAANGLRWRAGLAREVFFDAFACRTYCRKISQETLGEAISLCGLCVRVCPVGSSHPK